VKDAHKKFIEEIKALGVNAKDEQWAGAKDVTKRSMIASGGNPARIGACMRAAKKRAVLQIVSIGLSSVKKSRPLSMNFAKEKMNAVQPNGGPQ